MAEDDLTPGQRDAVRALGAARGVCPAPDALVEYHALANDDRARHPIHAHVQVCSRCQLVLLNLDEPSALSTEALAKVARPMRWNARWALPIAAALAIAIVGPFVYRNVTRAPGSETIRGTELQPIAPIGSVRTVDTFEWQSPIRTPRYRVTVFRGSQIIWTGESAETRVVAPVTLPLERGVDYEWQVDAIDAEGSVRMSSPRTSFALMR